MDAGVFDFEENLAAGGEPRIGQILDHFVLRIDRDRLAAGEFREIDAMGALAEAQIYAVVDEAFALEACADAGFFQQIHGALLEDTGAHAFLHVLAAAIFEDDRLDAVKVQQMRENQAGGPGSDDANLRAHSGPRMNSLKR